MSKEDKSIHRTSTKKVFHCFDERGNSVNYEDYKDVFRSYLQLLNVGQQLKHEESGVILKRIE